MQGTTVLLVREDEENQEHVDRITTKWTGLTGDRLLRSVEDGKEVSGGR